MVTFTLVPCIKKCGIGVLPGGKNSRFIDPSIKRGEGGWAHNACPKRRKPKQGRIAKTKVRSASLRMDWLATEARHFKDGLSRVYMDGRERLFGEDYRARVREVLARDGGKCTRIMGIGFALAAITIVPELCGKPANEHPHHIKKRSKGRDDRAANLMSVCDDCHRILHPEHQTQFCAARRAPGVGEGT